MQSGSRQNLSSRFRALIWYLRRPKYYGDMVSRLKGKLLRHIGLAGDTKHEAALWCVQQGMDTSTALREITGNTPDRSLKSIFPNEFAFADQQAASCPVKMGGAADLSLIYWLCEYVRAQNVVETGVAFGWSSLAILLSLRNREESRLVSTDMPYAGRDNDAFVGCVVPAELRSGWQILRAPDRQVLPKALKEAGRIDLCHYDSDKSYGGRMWAYPLLWNSLRSGGVLISDDVGDNVAFRDFSILVNIIPIVVAYENKYSGLLIKP